jgi:hypothetical protein
MKQFLQCVVASFEAEVFFFALNYWLFRHKDEAFVMNSFWF